LKNKLVEVENKSKNIIVELENQTTEVEKY
jgi:hypothetical protein